MSIKTKITLAIVIAIIGYALTLDPNGRFFVPVAKLIKEKGKVEDTRVHSLDLKKLRSPNQAPHK